ncbi:two component transcriptional regulator, LytTR family [Parasphingorhabdus marina DSM 22363]|uniref:Two component transcriptional regulator, LytTR family n=1 Tax=Parasphingorhabdus marina DSM 22363 TaxID=1123272 RepID=A0A1N6D5N0_9SPHN|nr:LytTR family DNA-binding domain-containing protein [Parasphingorhabdus marina]SIN66085.1 two component transcriptional regulator, LytTR family [Parasphingorhabdus marina DSM 22363]
MSANGDPAACSPIHVLVVDDEPLARNRLRALCQRLDSVGLIDLCDSGEEACQKVRDHGPDLVLLDVDMPGLSGLEVADMIRSNAAAGDKVPEIVFTTAHSSYAAQAFRLDAADYLLKPVKQAQLEEAVARARERLRIRRQGDTAQPPPYLWVQDGAGSVQILCRDIAYILAERDYMRLCLTSGLSRLVHEPMHVLEDRLPSGDFLRIHRSTIVRKAGIREFRRDGRQVLCVLQCGAEFPVGPSYKNKIGQNIRTR